MALVQVAHRRHQPDRAARGAVGAPAPSAARPWRGRRSRRRMRAGELRMLGERVHWVHALRVTAEPRSIGTEGAGESGAERSGCPGRAQSSSARPASGAPEALPPYLRLRDSAWATPLSREGSSGGAPSSASGAVAENGAKLKCAETPSLARQRGHVHVAATRIGLNPLPHLSHLNIAVLPPFRSACCGPAVRNAREFPIPRFPLRP